MSLSDGYHSAKRANDGYHSAMQANDGYHSAKRGNDGYHSAKRANDGYHSAMQANDGYHSAKRGNDGYHSAKRANDGYHSAKRDNATSVAWCKSSWSSIAFPVCSKLTSNLFILIIIINFALFICGLHAFEYFLTQTIRVSVLLLLLHFVV